MAQRTKYLLLFGSVIAALFVGGIVWRALNPHASENPDEDATITARQDGCSTSACTGGPSARLRMYGLIKLKLPHDDLAAALRGCQEAQGTTGD